MHTRNKVHPTPSTTPSRTAVALTAYLAEDFEQNSLRHILGEVTHVQ